MSLAANLWGRPRTNSRTSPSPSGAIYIPSSSTLPQILANTKQSTPRITRTSSPKLFAQSGLSSSNDENEIEKNHDYDDIDNEYGSEIRDAEFLKTELEKVESMEEILEELEEYYLDKNALVEKEDDVADIDLDDLDYDTDKGVVLWSEETLQELLGDVPVDDSEDDYEDDEDFDFVMDSVDEGDPFGLDDDDDDSHDSSKTRRRSKPVKRPGTSAEEESTSMDDSLSPSAFANLEKALLQGVVPVSADVGSECLPGDFGFDPLGLANKDYFRNVQNFMVGLLPDPDSSGSNMANINNFDPNTTKPRPRALILRDYREAEIRHGRLAMLAAIIWPLQEMLDQLLLDPEQWSPLLYGPITLPYFPLIMTFIMLNLGYLDIYSQAIKDRDSIGEAFLPGDCFWDPLKILEGAPDSMKRNMQERELFNGRVAMLAIALFIWEEAITHLPLMQIGDNELLLKPAYEVPAIQGWLDQQFSTFDYPSLESTSDDALKDMLDDAIDGMME